MDSHLSKKKPKARESRRLSGRPPKGDDPNRRSYWEGDLHALLVRCLPEYAREDGKLNVVMLAAAMKYSAFRVYTFMNTDTLSKAAAIRLIDLSKAKPRDEENKLGEMNLARFVFS